MMKNENILALIKNYQEKEADPCGTRCNGGAPYIKHIPLCRA